MPRNFSNSSYWTQGTQGPPTPHRSTYQQAVDPGDTLPDPSSDSSGTQLAQNSTGNTSSQHDHNNHGGNSVPRGNSSSNATSGQSHHGSEGARHSSSRTNSNQEDSHEPRSSLPVPRFWNSPNQDFQSQGANYPNSSSLSDSRLAIYEGQPQREGTYDAVGGIYSDSRGGSGGYGSAGGTNQSEGYGRGYGGGSSRRVERGYENGDGDEDSLEAVQGSETSRRSSGSRR